MLCTPKSTEHQDLQLLSWQGVGMGSSIVSLLRSLVEVWGCSIGLQHSYISQRTWLGEHTLDNTYRVCVTGMCGALNISEAVKCILATIDVDDKVEVCIIKSYCRRPICHPGVFISLHFLVTLRKAQSVQQFYKRLTHISYEWTQLFSNNNLGR